MLTSLDPSHEHVDHSCSNRDGETHDYIFCDTSKLFCFSSYRRFSKCRNCDFEGCSRENRTLGSCYTMSSDLLEKALACHKISNEVDMPNINFQPLFFESSHYLLNEGVSRCLYA